MKDILEAEQLDPDGQLEKKFRRRYDKNPLPKRVKITKKAAIGEEFSSDAQDEDFVDTESTSNESDGDSDSDENDEELNNRVSNVEVCLNWYTSLSHH